MPDWSRISREKIAEVHRLLPEDATLKQRRAALKAAYPFGERQYWPYKAWCKAQRDYLAKVRTPRELEAQHAAWREAMRTQGFRFAGDDA